MKFALRLRLRVRGLRVRVRVRNNPNPKPESPNPRCTYNPKVFVFYSPQSRIFFFSLSLHYDDDGTLLRFSSFSDVTGQFDEAIGSGRGRVRTNPKASRLRVRALPPLPSYCDGTTISQARLRL